ncbi:hypothetical protein BDK51DRAFT_48820 [Blyttiomyces helicus]|uniref:HMG-CoA reductase N-terminal domain-containing protein n=1 Tax=Blyttiomyces helicus TaxID=388810 RepID=A0A4P9W1Q3_9FUNG|nr:hypothetical protein BDK51DRAFT_48820 [Blyttiomyces helicus]|eukprot:RKO85285.1 hypothetical protein BDK51DRAFT_48820 [Blyttiomyces helicus]
MAPTPPPSFLSSLALRLLAPLVRSGSSRHPLETIALCLLVASSCYLSLIHHSVRSDSSSLAADPNNRGYLHPLRPTRLVLDPSGAIVVQKVADEDANKGQPDGSYRHLLLKQVVVTSQKFAAVVPPQGVLTRSILRSAVELEAAVRRVSVDGLTFDDLCLRSPAGAGPCVATSPLTLWNNDAAKIDADRDPLATVARALANTVYNPPIRSTLGPLDIHPASNRIVGASYLILSFVIDVSDPARAAAASKWDRAVDAIRSELLYPDIRPVAAAASDDHESVWLNRLQEYWDTSSGSDMLVVGITVEVFVG